ncbi:MAG: hypothetical protein JWO76_2847, partial [Nocardioides sp.]|nr:hypothetical protein [Nocardioides sp.]
GAGLVAENAARCVGAVGLMAADVDSPVAYGLCLVLGYVAAVAWPSTYRLQRVGDASPAAPPWAFLGGASGGQLIGQTVLTGGPVALALAGGSAAEVTALFAGLALFRAPYTLALGLVSQLTGRLTMLVVRDRRQDLRRIGWWLVVATLVGAAGAALVGATAGPPLLRLVFGSDVTLPGRLTLVLAVGSTFAIGNLVVTLVVRGRRQDLHRVARWLLVATLVGSGGAALVGALAGPPLLRLVFGSDVSLPGRLTLVLAVASTIAIANLVATLVVLALGRTLALVGAWVAALVPGVLWFTVSGAPALDRTCATFLLVEAVAFALLLLEQARGTRDLPA